MKSILTLTLLTLGVILAVLGLGEGRGLRGAGPAAAPVDQVAGPTDIYQQIVDDYLNGKWEFLAKDVDPRFNKTLAKLTPAQTADVDYIRQTLAESRPVWWGQCKKGHKVAIHPTVWNRNFIATFNPDGKLGANLNYDTNTKRTTGMVLNWPFDDMDSTALAEHGFTKGDVVCLDIWGYMESAEIAIALPAAKLINLSEDELLQFHRYIDFRDYLTAAYYGTPHARRWELWLALYMYDPLNAKNRTTMPRKALGAMFLAEVVSHPRIYTSITLPTALSAEGAESTLAQNVLPWIEKHPWTLAEDKALRKVIKAFADGNGPVVYQSGKITLPNGLPVYIDPTSDRDVREKRDNWLKQKYDNPANK